MALAAKPCTDCGSPIQVDAGPLNQPNSFLYISAIVFAVIVFVVDVTIPLGIAAGVPYVVSIVFAGQTQSRKYLIAVALACSLLTLLVVSCL